MYVLWEIATNIFIVNSAWYGELIAETWHNVDSVNNSYLSKAPYLEMNFALLLIYMDQTFWM